MVSLIRSAQFDDGTIKFGPNNVLKFIVEDKNLDYNTFGGRICFKRSC